MDMAKGPYVCAVIYVAVWPQPLLPCEFISLQQLPLLHAMSDVCHGLQLPVLWPYAPPTLPGTPCHTTDACVHA